MPISISEAKDLSGKRVLVRVDWNVPLLRQSSDGQIVLTEDFRIRQSLSTIEYLKDKGAKVILMSHLESKDSPSLRPIYEYVKKLLPLSFCEESVGDKARECIDTLKEGEVLLLENLRLHDGEKENAGVFAEELALLGEIYVNEAFSASHRNHASIVGIPKFLPSFAGLRFMKEIEELSKAFSPEHPFLFIIGGAKFETKIPLIEKFLTVADSVFVGGALAHNFFKEKGEKIGDSLVSSGDFHLEPLLLEGKINLPIDMVIKGKDGINTDTLTDLGEGDVIVDAGPRTLEVLTSKIKEASFVVWNGPLGNYEQGFTEYTEKLANVLAENGKEVIVGGADTLSAIKHLGIFDKFSFVSTGGGAMLDFLANETLPGIEALTE